MISFPADVTAAYLILGQVVKVRTLGGVQWIRGVQQSLNHSTYLNKVWDKKFPPTEFRFGTTIAKFGVANVKWIDFLIGDVQQVFQTVKTDVTTYL